MTDARLPFRTSDPVIYHVNGFLPARLLEDQGSPIIFDELDFADRSHLTPWQVRTAPLDHLTKNTLYSFLGLSLERPDVRHLLRQECRVTLVIFTIGSGTSQLVSPSMRSRHAIEQSMFETTCI